MYNIADESVQFSPTQLFIQSRRGCSASNGQGVQLGRYIQAKEWESEINRRKYIQKVKKACDVTVCSYSALISDDYPFETYSGEQYLEDTDYDLEEIVMKNLDLERLHDALKTLSQEQMDLICALYLRDEPMSVSQYASVLGISKNAVQCRKNVILNKLRKFMDAEA